MEEFADRHCRRSQNDPAVCTSYLDRELHSVRPTALFHSMVVKSYGATGLIVLWRLARDTRTVSTTRRDLPGLFRSFLIFLSDFAYELQDLSNSLRIAIVFGLQ